MASLRIAASAPGIFYSRPSPEQPAYKTAGDLVEVGETIGLIEVMKTFIEVRADHGGRFVAYLVEDEGEVMADDAVCELGD